jgi:hypothetical protein
MSAGGHAPAARRTEPPSPSPVPGVIRPFRHRLGKCRAAASPTHVRRSGVDRAPPGHGRENEVENVHPGRYVRIAHGGAQKGPIEVRVLFGALGTPRTAGFSLSEAGLLVGSGHRLRPCLENVGTGSAPAVLHRRSARMHVDAARRQYVVFPVATTCSISGCTEPRSPARATIATRALPRAARAVVRRRARNLPYGAAPCPPVELTSVGPRRIPGDAPVARVLKGAQVISRRPRGGSTDARHEAARRRSRPVLGQALAYPSDPRWLARGEALCAIWEGCVAEFIEP